MNSPLADREADLVDGADVTGEELGHPLEPDLGHARTLPSLALDCVRDRMASSCRCKRLSNHLQQRVERGAVDDGDEAHDGVPTITTVARLANVSIASASRVLNGIRTNPDTFARVTEAAEAIGYAPNAAARSLRSRRTGQIAFAMPDVGNPVYTTMVGAIQEVARAHGLALLLHSTGADRDDELAMVRDLKHATSTASSSPRST
jgi:hypothetical protein